MCWNKAIKRGWIWINVNYEDTILIILVNLLNEIKKNCIRILLSAYNFDVSI